MGPFRFLCKAALPVGLLLLSSVPIFGQMTIKRVVADSASRQVLPFATIKPANGAKAIITSIHGGFSILTAGITTVTVSHTGYQSRTLNLHQLETADTIWLQRRNNTLDEVVIRSDFDKIRRIINLAIRNKPLHNPDLYDAYQCDVYYKMFSDMVPLNKTDSTTTGKKSKTPRGKDSLAIAKKKQAAARSDSNFRAFAQNSHLVFSEVFSQRYYRRPGQLQEIILASRFSGLKKTYFTNLVTNVLPFHIYGDYITVNGTDYLHPLAKGWQQRYQFRLEEEIVVGTDTTFVLSYKPQKNSSFEGLQGSLYINSNGYAVSHFIGSNTNNNTGRQMQLEQVYTLQEGRWFPQEINYALRFKGITVAMPGFTMDGHALVSNLRFEPANAQLFDKAYPVKLADSIDIRSEAYWQQLRPDTITSKERTTYRFMDSFFAKRKIERLMEKMTDLPLGRIAVGKLSIDIAKLLASNSYEGTRVGLGLYTNDKVSRYFSIGGWAGYGTQDKAWKYGASATIYPKANKDNWWKLAYSNNYRNAGTVSIHPELDRMGLRNWLLQKPDRVEEYMAALHLQSGYWQIELAAQKQQITNLYNSSFTWQGQSITAFGVREATVGLRYAHGEKRVPVMGYYMPDQTVIPRYPIVYMAAALGKASAAGYRANYLRALLGVTYTKHSNRWGNDEWRLVAGGLLVKDDVPLPQSLLLAGNGLKRDGINFYAPGAFITMGQSDVYSSSFVSLHYLHRFDKYLWKTKFSQPFISIGHNMLQSKLAKVDKLANKGIAAADNGYHESGLLLNQILQTGIGNLFTAYLNVGAFYHWAPTYNWQQNGVWVAGIGVRF
jgi:hypothetical protein